VTPTWQRRLVISATSLAVVASTAAVALSFVPIWPLALLPHFRIQHAVVALVVLAAAAFLRMRAYAGAAALAFLVLVVTVAPDLSAARRAVPAGEPVRVLLLNVHTRATSYAEVRALIDETKADVVALIEVDDRWLRELAPSLAGYSAHLEAPRADNFGMAVYGRMPFSAVVEELGGGTPSIVVRAAQFSLVVVHPLPPVSGAALAQLESQFAATGARVRALPGPVILAGDLNATPWSPPFRALVDGSGLCDTRAGFGVQPTWPASFAPMRIPIDHVLADCSIGVADRWVARDVGSDHLPVVVDLVIPSPTR
jgi:endonuclease/exonuclease/phosphatase (EEP) superfamily protein YafD